jgi:Mg-chelatase subunit ChlD
MRNLKKFKILSTIFIISSLLFSTFNNIPIFLRGKNDQVISRYLCNDEEIKVVRELKIGNETYFIVYEVYKSGRSTGDFLIFDFKKNSVVGGLEKFYPSEDIKEIVSFNFLIQRLIASNELVELIKNYNKIYISSQKLFQTYTGTIGPEWSKDLFVKKVLKSLIVNSILITGAALIPGAQMSLPILVSKAILTTTEEVMDLVEIMKTLEGNDEQFLPYHNTLAFLGLEGWSDEKRSEYLSLIKNNNLLNMIKSIKKTYESYEAITDYIIYTYAILKFYYEQKETREMILNTLKLVGLSEDALEEGGIFTKAVTTILRLRRINEYEFYGALRDSINLGVISDKIFSIGLESFGWFLGMIFDYKIIKPTIEMKTLVANGFLYSQLMMAASQYFMNIYRELLLNQLPCTESTLIKTWLGEYFYYNSLADFWSKIEKADEKQIELLLKYDKNGEFGKWLGNEGVNISSTKNIREDAGKKRLLMFNESLKYLANVAMVCSQVQQEYERYMKIMQVRRGIAGGLLKVEADIVLCLDTSGSMGTKLGSSTRIEESKKAAEIFLNLIANKGVKVGLVKFDTSSIILSELNDDFTYLKNLIRGLNHGGNTAMGEGIINSIETLSKGKAQFKSIILLTDGVSNTGRDPEKATDDAKNRNIKIFTIGMGDIKSGEFNPVLLKRIAEKTGAIYYEYDLSKGIKEDALWEIYIRIISSMAEEKVINQFSSKIAQGEEQSYYINISSSTMYFTAFLSYSGSRLQLELKDPESNVISANEWNAVYRNDTGVEVWRILNPQRGGWEMKVKGITVHGRVPYVLTVQVPRLRIEPERLNIEFTGERENVNIYLTEISGDSDIYNMSVKVLPPLDKQAVQKSFKLDIQRGSTKTINLEFIRPSLSGIYEGAISVEYEGLEYKIPVSLKYMALHIAPVDLKYEYAPDSQIDFSVYVSSSNGSAISNAYVFAEDAKGRYLAEESPSILGLYHLSIPCPRIKGHYYINLSANKIGYSSGEISLLIKVASIVGDINYDGLVDYLDLVILVSKYNSGKGDVGFLEDADINSDNVIDYRDLALLIANYGRHS